ncbi:glycoside hydrolase family 3 N-terminal domain-containing protein [Paenibacillus sp. GP183]|uniref:glycoside hydrolase family 3 N-terminal domain-containing protein n=1 Tax=Paenibacillus sp. GP183 TaxID=1882751 RepID=UPI000897BABE|nr:glycoside hydrolase family 3 N-terminal domain-containing protein [Paenibacillus sp. GP183]SEC01930.1 beta-glucosidase [Paenibacillus sp. GP183]
MLKRKISAAMAIALVCSTFGGLVPASTASATSKSALLPYYDASLPVETRVADLLSRMTLEEKVGQMVQAERASVTQEDVHTYKLGSVLSGGGSFPNGKQADSTREKWADLVDSYQAAALSTNLGIPILYGVDAVHGNNNLIGATLFPHNIGLGATRDPELVLQIGAASAMEIKAAGTNWAFAPTITDPQDVRWGRSYEGFGDNQSLSAIMGSAYIQGLQGKTREELKSSDKVVATAKHFLGEGLTDNGANQGNVSMMTEQEVLNLDLPMYKAAINAGARTVMVSYSSIQGLKMHANKRILTDALKGTGPGQLGFTGFVITDYNGVHQITKDWNGNPVSGLKDQIGVAVNAGVDMLMEPSDWKISITYLKQLAEEGKIALSRIDDAVMRILRVKFESGVFEHPMTDENLATAFGSDANRSLARRAVRESLVLLKNDKVNGQPILSQLKKMNKILVAGKSADNIGLQSGGWSITWQGKSGSITPGTTILEGIKNTVRGSKTVTYNKHGRGAAGHDVAIVVIGETPYAEGNGDNLGALKLDEEDLATLQNVRDAGVPAVVVLVSGRPMIINDQLTDMAGIVEAWLPGTEGQGVADVLFGSYDFKGKLPVRWPFYTEAYTVPKAGQRNLDPKYILFDYGYGLTKTKETPALPAIPEQPGKPPYQKVEAEDFIAQQGIQTENTSDVGGGQNIGWTDPGDWMEYLINVPVSGSFDIDFRHAGQGDNTGFDILNASGTKIGELSVNNTGGWQNWQTTKVKNVPLTQGVQKIKLVLKAGGLNFNWFGSTGFSPAALPGNGGGAISEQPVVAAGAVENWVTAERDSISKKWYYGPRWQAGDKRLEQQANLNITALGTDPGATTININPRKEYQSVMGIGTSMEESTVYNLVKMSPAKQEEWLKKLASKTEGIGMSMVRVTIGTADFTAQKFYTYDDMPPGHTDPALEHFSIQKDIDFGIVGALKKMKAINPGMKIFASPWSPPGWMKTTDSMIRGQVKDEYLPVLADYYVKYIQAYKAQGIDIEAMTLQNEPLLEIDYPSTKMPWQQEAELAKLLKKKLAAAGLDVKLWIFDHNPGDTMSYPAPLLAVPENRDAVEGTAFHDYGGDLALMSQLHDMYPDKNVYMTERAVWGTEGTDRIAQYFRNWARSYNSWVAMLDSDIATHQWVGTPDPTMLVQDSSDRNNYWLTPEYYFLGNFSKFVEPGYIRINSDYGSKNKVTNVSFLSPDKKTIVTVVINQTNDEQTFKLVSDGTQIAAKLPAKSVATYRWKRLVDPSIPDKTPVLTAEPNTLDYGVDGKTVLLKLAGGTFVPDQLGQITLSGEAAAKGITVTSVTYGNPNQVAVMGITVTGQTYGNPNQVAVKLAWNGTPYYGNLKLTLNVPPSAYTDSTGGEMLSASVNLQGTVYKTNPKALPGTITSDDYYQLSGVTAGAGSIADFGPGDWADFKINVPKEGKYAFTVKAKSPNGSIFRISPDGTTPVTVTIPSLFGSNAWIGARTTVDLKAGVQTLRIAGSVGAFDLQEIAVQEVLPQMAGTDGILKVEAESFTQAGQNVIQYGGVVNNLGYTVAGTYMDYLITVPETGYYAVKYRYATAQSGVSMSLASGGQTKATTGLPGTGDWGNYTQVTDIVQLNGGTQTIRLTILGDGTNLDWFQLEKADAGSIKGGKVATPVINGKNGNQEYGHQDNPHAIKLSTTTAGAVINYTTDGSLPTKDSEIYSGPINVKQGAVIRAIAVKEGMADSYVVFYSNNEIPYSADIPERNFER